MVRRDHGQKPLRGGGDGGGSNPWSSSIPDFSITTCARSLPETGRALLDWATGVGDGTAAARAGGGEVSDVVALFPTPGAGVFAGLGVFSCCRADFDPAVFLVLPVVSFSGDFFFALFGFGVAVWRRFDFGEALCSGVSRGVADPVASSRSSECFGFFADLLVGRFALGVGDLFGLGEEAECVSVVSDSSPRFFCSSLTCARTRPVAIAPTASAVANQMRKRATATERNRARHAIN